MEGVDPVWLDRLYAADPAAHALAVWDRLAWPETVAFRTLLEDGKPVAYLLLWNGLPHCPVVHWMGDAEDPAPLLAALPPRPLLAIVPPSLEAAVTAARGPSTAYPLRLRARAAGPPPPGLRPTRRLTPSDQPWLRALAEADRSTVTDTYLAIDLAREWVVGGFESGRLVAVARAEVRLPRVWHVSGVSTVPRSRGQGWGRAVVGQLLADAAAVGAETGLFVREDNEPARRLYDALGFGPGVRRVWVDAGADRAP